MSRDFPQKGIFSRVPSLLLAQAEMRNTDQIDTQPNECYRFYVADFSFYPFRRLTPPTPPNSRNLYLIFLSV